MMPLISRFLIFVCVAHVQFYYADNRYLPILYCKRCKIQFNRLLSITYHPMIIILYIYCIFLLFSCWGCFDIQNLRGSWVQHRWELKFDWVRRHFARQRKFSHQIQLNYFSNRLDWQATIKPKRIFHESIIASYLFLFLHGKWGWDKLSILDVNGVRLQYALHKYNFVERNKV